MPSIERPDSPYALLLVGRGVEGLPIPAPLDLAEIPFIRAASKLEKRDENGNLPIEAYKLSYEIVGAHGSRYRMLVQGSAEEGLPYGRDGDILLALFKLIDQHRLVDGVFPSPSVRMIADALGLPMNGQNAERIRGALLRFSHVRIETRQVFRAEDLAESIRNREVDQHPVQPDRGIPRRTGTKPAREEEVVWLLQYRWKITYDRVPDGEAWIQHLWVNPLWVAQAVAGWAAWIDTAVYTSLGGSLARRLYQIMAACAARGRPPAWTYDLDELWMACGISSNRRRNEVRDDLMKAGAELCDQGVLRRFNYESGKRGQYTLFAEPGPRLEIAQALRGVGLLDLEETRIQLLLLSQLGINATVARQLVEQGSHQLYWVLCYTLYRRELACEGRGTPIENPGGFIRRLAQEGFNPRSDEGFLRWYERQMAASELPLSQLTPTPSPALPASSAPTLPPFEVEPRDTEAAEHWAAVIEGWTDPNPMLSVALSQIAPYAVEGEVLACLASMDLYARWVRERALPALERRLEEHTGGALRQIVIRVQPGG